jgi:hypothetical protein
VVQDATGVGERLEAAAALVLLRYVFVLHGFVTMLLLWRENITAGTQAELTKSFSSAADTASRYPAAIQDQIVAGAKTAVTRPHLVPRDGAATNRQLQPAIAAAFAAVAEAARPGRSLVSTGNDPHRHCGDRPLRLRGPTRR